MAILSYGSLDRIYEDAAAHSGADNPLPGIALAKYTVKDSRDPFFAGRAEVYMFGVAGDSKLDLKVIPFGQANLDKNSDVNQIRKVEEGAEVTYLGEGLPLVLPPVHDFLALRLLLADSDRSARDAAEVITSVSEAVGAKETATLLALTGLPHAAAAAVVFGKVLATASKMLAKNRDDVIETFEGYFTSEDLLRHDDLVVDNPGARATFSFVAP